MDTYVFWQTLRVTLKLNRKVLSKTMNIRAVIMTALICVHKINKGCKHNLHPSTILFLLIPFVYTYSLHIICLLIQVKIHINR